MTFIVLDVETKGLDPEADYIVELSAKKYSAHNHKIKETGCIDYLLQPPFYMSQNVIDIHGITNEILQNEPTEEQMFSKIQEFFGEKPILVGFNVGFDVAMLSSLYSRNNSNLEIIIALDVLEMARDLIYGKDVINYKLETLIKLFGLEAGLTFHCAIDDVEATARLLSHLYQEYKSQLVNDQDQPQKENLYINYYNFWKGYNKEQSGLYVTTNLGRFYYSTYKKAWFACKDKKTGKKPDFDFIDVDSLEDQVLQRTGLTNRELGRLTEKRFKELKYINKEIGLCGDQKSIESAVPDAGRNHEDQESDCQMVCYLFS